MSQPDITSQPYDISIAIPTYNGAQRLPDLLDKLESQIGVNHLRWEILVVDNNSHDNTAKIIHAYQAKWQSNADLVYVFEAQQGAAFARKTAIQKAKSELVGFLDDDNLPAENWVNEAVKFSRQFPQAGAFSGRIDGDFEGPPPEGFEKIKPFLAIRNHGDKVVSFEPEKLRLPPAASLVVRRQAWIESVPGKPIFAGRLKSRFMLGGEDYEVLLYLHKAGWEILYDPDLQTTHRIPQQRFERSYLLRLARGCGLTTCQLTLINTNPKNKPFVVFRIAIGSFRRLCHHVFKHKSQFKSNLENAFEFEFHLGSMLSPLCVRRWS